MKGLSDKTIRVIGVSRHLGCNFTVVSKIYVMKGRYVDDTHGISLIFGYVIVVCIQLQFHQPYLALSTTQILKSVFYHF